MSLELRPKKPYASVAVPPAPVWVPSQWLLASSVTSVTSVNDKGDSNMIPRTVHRSPDICLTADKNPGVPQLRDHLMKAV